jgi:hypothetical protein
MDNLQTLVRDFHEVAQRAVMNTPEELVMRSADGRIKAIREMVETHVLTKDAAFDRIALVMTARDAVIKNVRVFAHAHAA